jgi:hypothetical protein
MRWVFTFNRSLSEEEVAELLADVPGVSFRKRCFVPENAREIVLRWGRDRGLAPQAYRTGDDRGVRDLRLATPLIREWVPEFLTPYQRRGLAASCEWPDNSGAFVWSAGSGKTLAAIIWALAGGKPVVIVTKAAVKLQVAGEVERYTFVRPVILEGETPNANAIVSTMATERGTAPVLVIISYEILPAWIPVFERSFRGKGISLIFDESQKVSSKKRWAVETVKEEEEETVEELDRGIDLGFLFTEPPAAAPVDLTVFDMDGAGGASGIPPEPIAIPEPKVKFTLADNIAAAAMRLTRLASRRLLTTATPIRDRVRNLWAQLDLCQPYEWGNYWTWARRYAGAVEAAFGMTDDGYSNLVELKARIDTMTHRVFHAEANRYLPPKRRIVTYVAAKDQVKSGMVAEVRAAAKRGNEALREVLFFEAAARKRRRLFEKIDADVEGGLKTVVFTGRRRDVDAILEAVTKRHGKTAFITGGHGAHSTDEREAMRIAYMAAPGPAILVGTTDAWGEGLNLQDTDHLLVALLPWTPGSIVQLEGRVARLGQTRAVLIEYLIAEGTIDERIASLLLSKMPAVEKVIGQDEVSGFAADLSGVDDADLVKTMAAKIIGGGREL